MDDAIPLFVLALWMSEPDYIFQFFFCFYWFLFQALTRARVPVVKLMDPVTGISCDICVNNVLAVVNTKLLHDYARIDVRLRQLAFIVKHWAKSRGVNVTYQGTLSSYAWVILLNQLSLHFHAFVLLFGWLNTWTLFYRYVLMCIHFLQQRRPPILPCLQVSINTWAWIFSAVTAPCTIWYVLFYIGNLEFLSVFMPHLYRRKHAGKYPDNHFRANVLQ